jgi:choline dehydrogenase-like flavoprotein
VKPHLSRPNLNVISGVQASRVIFDTSNSDTPRATGVEYFPVGSDGTNKEVIQAKKEIILSGGGLLSPWLLMLSGVGPREALEKHEIDVVLDLPGTSLSPAITCLPARSPSPFLT